MWQILINGPGYFDTPYNLPDGDTHLGRADENDVVLTGDKVSRRHARLRVSEGKVFLEDLGSRNGTSLADQAVKAAVQLKEGDVVTVGENTLTLRLAGEAEESRTEILDESKHLGGSTLSRDAAELAGQVLFTRDLRHNSFIASFEQARSMSVAELQQATTQDNGQVKSLALLYKVVDALASSTSLDAFLQQMLDMVMELAAAKTGVVLLKNAKGTFSPVVVRHAGKLQKGEVPVSDAIVSEVVQKKVALCVADAQDDARFKSRESVILYAMKQVLCVPMMHDGAITGLIYLNREAATQEAMSLESLIDLLTAIAQLSANGAQQAKLKAKAQSEEKIRRTLERFHAPDVVDRLVKDLGKGQAISAKVDERVVTVVFADIAGFTALTERLPAPRVVELLNEFYRRMTRIVFSFGGTVDKFIGDSVMAIFGAPYQRPDDASRAVRAALSMRREFVELITSRPVEERCGIKLSVNTGKVLAGIVGSDARMEYTALGDPVNVASRLEETALPGQLLVTKATLDAVGGRFQAVPLGERALRGKKEKTAIFELLDEDPEWQTSPGV